MNEDVVINMKLILELYGLVPWSTALHVSQTHTKGIKSIVV